MERVSKQQLAMMPIEFKLNGQAVVGRSDETIIETAKHYGIAIPHLCYKEDMRPDGNCRACVVEIKGERVLAPSCCRYPKDGMEVTTDSARAVASQKMVLELLLSDIPEAEVPAVQQGLLDLGLDWRASGIRGALVACTGNTGCKFSATDTKGQALALAQHLESRIALDRPVTIHLTGCPNSCAQHYVGDIGLLGLKVGEDMVEGYAIYVGGGAGVERGLGREVYAALPMAEVPRRVEGLLRLYLAERRGAGESFLDFTRARSLDALRQGAEAALLGANR